MGKSDDVGMTEDDGTADGAGDGSDELDGTVEGDCVGTFGKEEASGVGCTVEDVDGTPLEGTAGEGVAVGDGYVLWIGDVLCKGDGSEGGSATGKGTGEGLEAAMRFCIDVA